MILRSHFEPKTTVTKEVVRYILCKRSRILMDHPRLYFNDGCTPGSEWIRLTPLKVPRDRIWTAKDDNRFGRLEQRRNYLASIT